MPPALLLASSLLTEEGLSPHLRERLVDAARALAGDEPVQPNGSPVDDLGIRTFEDRGSWLAAEVVSCIPRERLERRLADLPAWDSTVARIAAVGGIELVPTARWEPAECIDGASPVQVSAWLAAYAGPLGQWDDAFALADVLPFSMVDDARLATRAATVLAGRGSQRARAFFAAAIDLWNDDPWERFLTALRAYAAEVKRMGDAMTREQARAVASNAAAHAGDGQPASAATHTRTVAGALLSNLDALVAVRSRDGKRALAEIERASELVLTPGADSPDMRPAGRELAELRIQVLVNHVTMMGVIGRWQQALDICRSCLAFTDGTHEGFIAEVHAMLALCALNLDDVDLALAHSRIAAQSSGAWLSPRQSAQVHKLHSVAAARSGFEDEASASVDKVLASEALVAVG